MESYTYPAALGGLYFSATRALFRVVPVSVHTVENLHRGTTHSHDFLQFWYTVSGSWYHTANCSTPKSCRYLTMLRNHCSFVAQSLPSTF